MDGVDAALPVLAAPRLVLSPVTRGDGAAVLSWWNDAEVRRGHGLGMEPLGPAAFQYWLGDFDRADTWVARMRAGGEPVGLLEMKAVRGADGALRYELGIAVDARHRRTGVGLEMVGAACAWALRTMGARAVVAQTRADNRAARRLFERAGFTRTGEGEGASGRAGRTVRYERSSPGPGPPACSPGPP